ncbi:hypothetical protein HWV62_34291 [Athelia sp. TMB]|nr:hypothetical protein HWV62_34291 [Athelia sp. TMB]
MSIPQSQKALALPGPLDHYTLITRPVPTPGEGDVLVRVESTGLNPAENHVTKEATRWVLQGYPALTGTDGAGTIVALGKGVVGFEVGDRVFFQEVSSIPLAFATAAFGLSLPVNREPKGLGGAGLKPFWEAGAQNAYKDKPIVVLGAIQIASYLGFNPIVTTASAHNADHLKRIGATDFVDRKADLASALKQIIPSAPIEVIFDAVHTPLQQADVDLLCPGGVIATIWPVPEGEDALKLSEGRVATYFYGSVHLHKELGVAMYARLTEFLEKGIIKPLKVEKLPNGLGGIVDGLARLDRREVSGFKLVASPPETPDF